MVQEAGYRVEKFWVLMLLVSLCLWVGTVWAVDENHADRRVEEDHTLVTKMWKNSPSSADVRAGIERALEIPSWHPGNPTKSTTSWTQVGRTIVDPNPNAERDRSGRVRCAAWAWDNDLGETTLWAGSSSGGLYKLGRATVFPAMRVWIPVSNTLPGSPSVGAFLVKTGNSNLILVGTGDKGRKGDEGSGLYRTTNGGTTWTRISLFPEPAFFFKMIADPSDATGQRVYAATSTGVFISHDFGLTWGRSYSGSATNGVTDIARANSSSDWILGVPGTGVVHCSLLTTTFSNCIAGTGTSDDGVRVSVAVSPSNPSYVYALTTDSNVYSYGIFRSGNGGDTFVDLDPRATQDLLAWGQNFHTHAIAVDPLNPARLMVGLAAGQMTQNATAANTSDVCWHRNIAVPPSGGCDTPDLDVGHADQTSMAFVPQSVDPLNTDILITNDGGVFVYDWWTDTIDDTYNEWGMNISQTYNSTTFDLSLTDKSLLAAGLQDNGNIRIDRDGLLEKYRMLTDGDGGVVSIHPNNPDTLVFTVGLAYNRFLWIADGPRIDMNVNLGIDGNPAMTYNHEILTPVIITHDGRYLFWRWLWEGNNVNWRYVNPYHPLPTGVNIKNIETGRLNPLVLYITDWNSTANGTAALYVMEEGVTGTLGDMNWEDRTPSGSFVADVPDGGWVFSDRSTNLGQHVYFATGGDRPSRAYLSRDRGASWWDVTGDLKTNLPDVHYWQLLAHPMDYHQLFLATEVGIFRSDNSGQHWYRYMQGLPDVVKVRAMHIHSTGPDETELIIATWGNGIWQKNVEFQELIFWDGFESNSVSTWSAAVGN